MLFTSDINTHFTSFGVLKIWAGKRDWSPRPHSLGTMGLSKALLDEPLAAIPLKLGGVLTFQDQGDLSRCLALKTHSLSPKERECVCVCGGGREAEASQPQERLSGFSEVGGWSQTWLLAPDMAASPLG